MSRRIEVDIVGDSASVERAFARSSASAQKFDKNLGSAVRGATAGSGVFQHLGRSLAFASGGFLAFAGVTNFLKASINAGRDSAVAQRQLAQQLKVSGASFGEWKDRIEQADLKLSHLSGFTSTELEQSLTTLDRSTGDITKSLKYNAVAADVARGRHISLAQASLALGKAAAGSTTALKRLGIEIPKGVEGYAALNFVAQKFAGQARTGTSVSQRFAATLHDTEIIIGRALLPTVNKYLVKLGDWLNKMNRSGKLQRDVNAALKDATAIISGVKSVLEPLVGIFKALGDAVGGTRNELKLLGAAVVAAKLTSLAGGLSGIGSAAARSKGEVLGLRGALLRLGAIGVITVGVELLFNRKGVDKAISGFLDKHGLPGGTNQLNTQQVIRDYPKLVEAFGTTKANELLKTALGQIFAPFQSALNGISRAAGNGVGAAATANRVSVPGGVHGIGNSPLTAAQQLQIGLAANPNSIPLLNQQAANDRAKIAFLGKLRAENRITNAQYVTEVTGFYNDLKSTLGTIASVTKSATSAAAKSLRAAIPSHVSGEAFGITHGTFFGDARGIPGRVSGTGLFGIQHFNIPIQLQLAQARADALGQTSVIARLAQRVKQVALRALRSGKLSIQAQIDAWTVIGQINQAAQQNGFGPTGKVATAAALTRGIRFADAAARRAQEVRIAQALAHKGHIPTVMTVQGQPIIIHHTTELDGRVLERSVTTHQQKNGRYRPPQNAGISAGRGAI